MNNRYVCQSSEGERYETYDTVEECLERFKSYEQCGVLDAGDEICLEQALYRVVDGKLKPLTKGIKND